MSILKTKTNRTDKTPGQVFRMSVILAPLLLIIIIVILKSFKYIREKEALRTVACIACEDSKYVIINYGFYKPMARCTYFVENPIIPFDSRDTLRSIRYLSYLDFRYSFKNDSYSFYYIDSEGNARTLHKYTSFFNKVRSFLYYNNFPYDIIFYGKELAIVVNTEPKMMINFGINGSFTFLSSQLFSSSSPISEELFLKLGSQKPTELEKKEAKQQAAKQGGWVERNWKTVAVPVGALIFFVFLFKDLGTNNKLTDDQKRRYIELAQDRDNYDKYMQGPHDPRG